MINIWENIWASVHLFLYPLKYLWFIAVCIWSKEYPLRISEHFCLALPTSSVSEMVPPLPPRHLPHRPSPPPHPLSTVRHSEFSPFGWRLGFIWKAEGKPFGRRALRREGKLRCGRFWGGAREDREPGTGAFFWKPCCERRLDAMAVLSALWVLLLCQLLTSSSAQVRLISCCWGTCATSCAFI